MELIDANARSTMLGGVIMRMVDEAVPIGRGHAHPFPDTNAACSCPETDNSPTISTARGTPIITFTARLPAVLLSGSYLPPPRLRLILSASLFALLSNQQ
jgi:hypothetical protein